MYKTRVKTWALIIIAFLIIDNFANIKDFFTKTEYTVYSDVAVYPSIANDLNGYKKKGIKLKSVMNKEDADIIISDVDEINGYTKYELFETPIVVMTQLGRIANECDLITKNNSSFTVEASELFNNYLNDGTLLDIGLDIKRETDKNFKIVIPSQSTPYYNDVIDFIYLVFNNYKEVTPEDANRLEPTVEKFIDKTEKTSSIKSYLENLTDAGKKGDYTFIIMPEYIAFDCATTQTDSTYGFTYLYPRVTTTIKFNLFIKDNDKIETDKIIEAIKHKKFLITVNIRVNGGGLPNDFDSTQYYWYMPSPTVKNVQLE